MASPTLRGLVPMAHVRDVARSIDFYHQLGFETRNTLEHVGQLVWAWVDNGKAHLMLTRGGRPGNPDAQDVFFYLYVVRRGRRTVRSCMRAASKSARSATRCTCLKANSASTILMATACS